MQADRGKGGGRWLERTRIQLPHTVCIRFVALAHQCGPGNYAKMDILMQAKMVFLGRERGELRTISAKANKAYKITSQNNIVCHNLYPFWGRATAMEPPRLNRLNASGHKT